jgi:hypothetical protein
MTYATNPGSCGKSKPQHGPRRWRIRLIDRSKDRCTSPSSSLRGVINQPKVVGEATPTTKDVTKPIAAGPVKVRGVMIDGVEQDSSEI